MKYVVLGSSAAGINAVRELRRLDASAEIVLISKDKEIYSRCILHQYLDGERTFEGLNFADKGFEKLYKINWKKGISATGVDRANKQVLLDNGEKEGYDKLLIATGSHSYIPPFVKNLEGAKNVVGFRNIEDVEFLKEAAKSAKHIVIVGAGLVGIDCAVGLLELGLKPTLVDIAPWMLSIQLDERSAKTYQDIFSERGLAQHYGISISEVVLDENSTIKEAVLSNGQKIPCDQMIVTMGVRPNIEFLEGSGLETTKTGLSYDESGRTNDSDIYGAGDVSGKSPIWPVAVKEGIIAASNMAGVSRRMTDFFASKSTMNFFGIPTMSLGVVNNPEAGSSVEIQDDGKNYKKIIHKNGKITGAILQGDIAYSGVLQQLIAHRIDVSKVKKPLFDVDYSDFFHIDNNFEFYYEEAAS